MALQVIQDFSSIVQSLGKFQLIECSIKVYLVQYEIKKDKLAGELKDYRNYLAHQAFIANLENVDSGFKQFLGVNPILIDYDLLNKELDECAVLFTKEFNLAFKK